MLITTIECIHNRKLSLVHTIFAAHSLEVVGAENKMADSIQGKVKEIE